MNATAFQYSLSIRMLPHRERIMAKRELYGKARATQRPFGLIELFTTAERRKLRLPHQGIKECARRIANGLVAP